MRCGEELKGSNHIANSRLGPQRGSKLTIKCIFMVRRPTGGDKIGSIFGLPRAGIIHNPGTVD